MRRNLNSGPWSFYEMPCCFFGLWKWGVKSPFRLNFQGQGSVGVKFFVTLQHINMCMMQESEWKERTALLLGGEAVERLAQSRVLVAGVGGVGAYAAEMVCRAGVGHIVVVDADCVSLSNINRQLPAMTSTVGKKKAGLVAARLLDINPSLDIKAIDAFLDEENIPGLLEEGGFDFVIDAIDTIKPKVALICEALKRHTNIVSSMGAGAKTDITKIRFANVWDTFNCGLSRAVRQALKKQHMRSRKLPVVFSEEVPDMNAVKAVEGERNKKTTAGTVSYMPATFGCFLAEYVITHIISDKQKNNNDKS